MKDKIFKVMSVLVFLTTLCGYSFLYFRRDVVYGIVFLITRVLILFISYKRLKNETNILDGNIHHTVLPYIIALIWALIEATIYVLVF